MNRSKTGEWPLVVFTVGLQLATGIAIMAATEAWILSPAKGSIRHLAISVFPVLFIAILGSLFHVGRPFASWRALSNVGGSRLTTELVSCVFFACLALGELLLLWTKGTCSPILLTATAIVGVAAVASSSRIYRIPAQPLWDSHWMHISFLGSTLLFGGVSGLTVDDKRIPASSLAAQVLIWVGALLVVVSMLAMVGRLVCLGERKYRAPEAAPILRLRHWVYICVVVVIGLAVPLYSMVSLANEISHAAGVLFLTILGVSLSRVLMYSRGIELSRF